MSNTARFASICAATMMVLGMTATAQQSVALETKGFIGNCPPALGTLYAKFPTDIKELSAKGSRACIDTVDTRVKAYEASKDAEKKLKDAIANEKSSVVDILAAKMDYIAAWQDLRAADKPMHEPNFQAELGYFDWLTASAKNLTMAQSDAAAAAYEKWQAAVTEVERHPAPDGKLLAQADLVRAKREIREMEEFKKFIQTSKEMFERDAEMMKRLRTDK